MSSPPTEQPHLSTASIEDISISVKKSAVKRCIALGAAADSAVPCTVACLYSP